ncbi:GerMN domain-containing protein [Paenibacillus sp. VCA1]|uniref:GerMN domain-containing protein n=1 Tax=Paenibacillus sp. VCA1 TaxID=3039148 RepID=UPI002872017C|nr:GerMN domain-containing protein [Paenibacillus sp. VCA1]MDR9853935.1 GerMN domain-containing protein [Paenibacillus sp. VCA1]
MNKKILSAALLALVMVAGAGCGQKPAGAPAQQEAARQPDDTSVNAAQPDQTDADEHGGVQETQEGKEAEPNQEGKADEPGKPNKPGQNAEHASEQKQTIEVYYTDPEELELKKSEKEIKFAKESDKYAAAFKALQESGDANLIPLWGKMELKSLEFKNGMVTLDIHMPNEARLGAGGEQFALDALTKTLFQFKEVESIELLVDGQKLESLMGHMDLDHPIKRNGN